LLEIRMPPELPAVRILIVDDDKTICDYMQTLLERDGFQVKALSDPTLVEDEVRQRRFNEARRGRLHQEALQRG
jgi:CheY-like chemotaxis protein